MAASVIGEWRGEAAGRPKGGGEGKECGGWVGREAATTSAMVEAGGGAGAELLPAAAAAAAALARGPGGGGGGSRDLAAEGVGAGAPQPGRRGGGRRDGAGWRSRCGAAAAGGGSLFVFAPKWLRVECGRSERGPKGATAPHLCRRRRRSPAACRAPRGQPPFRPARPAPPPPGAPLRPPSGRAARREEASGGGEEETGRGRLWAAPRPRHSCRQGGERRGRRRGGEEGVSLALSLHSRVSSPPSALPTTPHPLLVTDPHGVRKPPRPPPKHTHTHTHPFPFLGRGNTLKRWGDLGGGGGSPARESHPGCTASWLACVGLPRARPRRSLRREPGETVAALGPGSGRAAAGRPPPALPRGRGERPGGDPTPVTGTGHTSSERAGCGRKLEAALTVPTAARKGVHLAAEQATLELASDRDDNKIQKHRSFCCMLEERQSSSEGNNGNYMVTSSFIGLQ
ncbi:uncharacterized protein LOC141490823 [Macrotis lagotis]|uniref:uncharacterized protein LOC141490823 n=1 Tax=Macrotis lagotis TaxID=92651 RepID=UPI003D683477